MESLSRLSGGKAITGPGIDGMGLLPDAGCAYAEYSRNVVPAAG